MSVDDQIRNGLHDIALATTPDVERNLEQVHRRRRRELWVSRGAAATASAAALTAALVVVSPGEDRNGRPIIPAPQPSQSVERSPRAIVEPVPDGLYRRVVDHADSRRHGVDPSVADEMLGRDGTLPLTLLISGEDWSQRQTDDAGRTVVGDYGNLWYDDQGRLVTVSRSPGCFECGAVYRVILEGDSLTLTFARAERPTPDERLVMEGTWRRQD